MKQSIKDSSALRVQKPDGTSGTTGWRALAWAAGVFAFLAIICVVAWETDSFKAFSELFGSIETMVKMIHFALWFIAIVAALMHVCGKSDREKSDGEH